MPSRRLFVSYARQDARVVHEFVDALHKAFQLRAIPVEIWVDFQDLRPGEQWDAAIQSALLESFGVLVFVSPASVQSEWVQRELSILAAKPDRFIVPIFLRNIDRQRLPDVVASRQGIVLRSHDSEDIYRAAGELADDTALMLGRDDIAPPVRQAEAPALAAALAQEVRGTSQERKDNKSLPDSVFVAHGHDDEALQIVVEFLQHLQIQPIILSQIAGPAQSLFQKFLSSFPGMI